MERKYKIPIYGGKMIIVFFNPETKKAVCDKYGLDVDEMNCYDAVMFKHRSIAEYVIVFKDYRLTPGIIAHESKHLLNEVFKYNGLNLDLNNDEAECYFLTWIVNRVHETIRKFDLKIK